MEEKKDFNVMGLTFRLFTLFVVLGTCLCLTGCGKQFARIEENQQALQSMVRENTEWIAALSTNMRQLYEKMRSRRSS